jgi:hypothetical protein
MLQIAIGCMKAIGFFSVIFNLNVIYDKDLKHMLQIAGECMEAKSFLSVSFKYQLRERKRRYQVRSKKVTSRYPWNIYFLEHLH